MNLLIPEKTAGRLVVYLAGPINGCTDAQAKDWRETAKEILNADTLDPMSRDYRGKEDDNVQAIVEGDKTDICASDVVLVNAAAPSWGTAMEIAYAHSVGRPVVSWVPDGKRISPWLRYHSFAIAGSIEAAVALIHVHFGRSA